MSRLLESLAVLAEVTGTEWSKSAVRVIEQELSTYAEADVMKAIRRCMTELRCKVTLADILSRLPNQHPGVEEAWAIAATIMGNENATVAWTDEIREAYGVAAALADDLVAARMAFKEAYISRVGEARANGKYVSWSVSLGWDKQQREIAIREAVAKGRLTHEAARKYCPDIALPNSSESVKLLEEVVHGMPAMPHAD